MLSREKIIKGIAAYEREQTVFLRLLRKRGSFTQNEFDDWFRGREWRRRMKIGPAIGGDTFILGAGTNGFNMWAERLELLQYMIRLELVDAKTVDGLVVYSLGDKNAMV